MRYLDTSLVVTLVTAEAQSAKAQRWLEKQQLANVAVSDWTVTETASALSIKQRAGLLDDVARARADRAFARLTNEILDVLPVSRGAFTSAARMSSRSEFDAPRW